MMCEQFCVLITKLYMVSAYYLNMKALNFVVQYYDMAKSDEINNLP
jgi:hypothetical protein